MNIQEAAKEYADGQYEPTDRGILYRETQDDFIAGAKWQAKQSPWISVEDRLPDYLEKVLVLYEYKGEIQIQQSSYWAKKIGSLALIKYLRGCQYHLSMKYWKPTEMY